MQLQDVFDKMNMIAYRNESPNNYGYKLLRFLSVKLANRILPFYLKHSNAPRGVDTDMIVSLTSFPARIKNVWITIETLKRQTIKPKKIVLWLSSEQFPCGVGSLPASLRSLIDNVFEPRFISLDLKSHKKYHYAFKQFPDDIVVLVDDDVFYNSHILEYLYQEHLNYPSCVVCTRGYVIQKGKRYLQWPKLKESAGPGACILPTGVGGVLYPPHCYDDRIFDIDAILKTCLRADDLWLSFMCRLKGTKIVKTAQFIEPLVITQSQEVALCKTNNGKINENDLQITKINEWAKKVIGVDFYCDK